MGVLLKNNAFGTLATEINTTISTLVLNSGNGGVFWTKISRSVNA